MEQFSYGSLYSRKDGTLYWFNYIRKFLIVNYYRGALLFRCIFIRWPGIKLKMYMQKVRIIDLIHFIEEINHYNKIVYRSNNMTQIFSHIDARNWYMIRLLSWRKLTMSFILFWVSNLMNNIFLIQTEILVLKYYRLRWNKRNAPSWFLLFFY